MTHTFSPIALILGYTMTGAHGGGVHNLMSGNTVKRGTDNLIPYSYSRKHTLNNQSPHYGPANESSTFQQHHNHEANVFNM